MYLFHPLLTKYKGLDTESKAILKSTINWFEAKGKERLVAEDQQAEWYADFIAFLAEHQIFARLYTPTSVGGGAYTWNTTRISAFYEVCGFYGLSYWYAAQVTSLGLGPIWMSENEEIQRLAFQYLKEGKLFAFALSEKEHGADIYASEMQLAKQADGTYLANGSKYYIGNANKARMISVFGVDAASKDYVWFVVDAEHPSFHLEKNVIHNQAYVAAFDLVDYPITENEILHMGRSAWDAALNTVNLNKYNLGWGSIGICTHALYEAINHAANRRLFDHYVTDFPHIQQLFLKSWTRLLAMRLFTSRSLDYLRVASLEDRRYLLYNALVKMKVTREGEQVINDLWDVISAKGFEKDTFFNIASRDIRGLPKLEGTVHVNMALVVKFIPNYFFNAKTYPSLAKQKQNLDDAFVFDQGPAKGLSRIQFHDFRAAYQLYEGSNVKLFWDQIQVFQESLMMASPNAEQQKDIDFLLTAGELFTLIVYGQLILEQAKLIDLDTAIVDQIFELLVEDFSHFALDFYHKPSATEKQLEYAQKMIRRPHYSRDRQEQIWHEQVISLKGAYEMSPRGRRSMAAVKA